jgi:hypothetical protein
MGKIIRTIDKKNFHWSETRSFFTGRPPGGFKKDILGL